MFSIKKNASSASLSTTEAMVTIWPRISQFGKHYFTFLVRIKLESGNFLSLQDDSYPYIQYYFFPQNSVVSKLYKDEVQQKHVNYSFF